MYSHLYCKSVGSTEYRFFCCIIPRDLKNRFKYRTKFYISINSVRKKDAVEICRYLKITADEIFAEIRMGMKDLSIEDIKEILRIEIRKQITWAHHVDVGTSQQKKKSGLAYLSNQEISLFEKFEEEKEYNKDLDKKLLSILESLKISINKNSLEYKVLRNNFKEIYELRYDWARSLLKKSGRSDDDFRREIERKLNLELFPELKSVPNLEMEDSRTTQIQELDRQGPSDQEVEFVYTDPLKSSKISKVITRYIEEKDYENIRTKDRVQVELNYLVEEFGDVAIGSIDKAKAFTLKTHLSLLPKINLNFIQT